MEVLVVKNSDDLFAYLDSLGIAYTNREHEPVFTVAESQALRDDIGGGHTKNLFLKDKKSNYFLLTVGDMAEINLKTIHQKIGAQGRVSFGSAEALSELLGVVPGSVTAFGVFNDTQGKVTLIFDDVLMDHEMINAHPLRNNATTSIARNDLLRFVQSLGREPRIEPLSERT